MTTTYAAKILADSISPDGVRLTTMEVTMPRIVLAEFNTHRMFSRNSASSRAIPVEKMIKRVLEHPYVPTEWGKNQKGMQADEELAPLQQDTARHLWLKARDHAVSYAEALLEQGLHKQLTNRLLEPFMWHTCIVTATEWSNFFNLRCHKDAHPDIRKPAELMRGALFGGEPLLVRYGGWHLPLVFDEDWDLARSMGIREDDLYLYLARVSCARCARVSYLTHEGKRDLQADIELADRLLTSGHMSPFEHVARPMLGHEYDRYHREVDPEGVAFCGNFNSWVPYRKTIPGEDDMLAA